MCWHWHGWCVSGTHHRVNNSYAQWWVFGVVWEGGGTTQRASLEDEIFSD